MDAPCRSLGQVHMESAGAGAGASRTDGPAAAAVLVQLATEQLQRDSSAAHHHHQRDAAGHNHSATVAAAVAQSDSPHSAARPQEAHQLLEIGAARSESASGPSIVAPSGGGDGDGARCGWPPLWLVLLLMLSSALLYPSVAPLSVRNSSRQLVSPLLPLDFPRGTPRCPSSRHAFMFYGLRPSADVLSFAVDLSEQTPYGVFVVVDDDDYRWSDAARHPGVHIVNMPAAVARRRNMTHMGFPVAPHSNSTRRAAAAMDKAMALAAYLFDDGRQSLRESIEAATHSLTLTATSDDDDGSSTSGGRGRRDGDPDPMAPPPSSPLSSPSPSTSSSRRLRYCRVWFVEDDTFIPSVAAAVRLDALAADFDYVAPAAELFKGARDPWPHWPQILRFENQPGIPSRTIWRHQMANALGVTDRFILRVLAFARARGRLLFSEVFLPTLAHAHDLSVWNPPGDLQLKWRLKDQKDKVNWRWEKMNKFKQPQRIWWHPIKNVTLRTEFRTRFRQIEIDTEQHQQQQHQQQQQPHPIAATAKNLELGQYQERVNREAKKAAARSSKKYADDADAYLREEFQKIGREKVRRAENKECRQKKKRGQSAAPPAASCTNQTETWMRWLRVPNHPI